MATKSGRQDCFSWKTVIEERSIDKLCAMRSLRVYRTVSRIQYCRYSTVVSKTFGAQEIPCYVHEATRDTGKQCLVTDSWAALKRGDFIILIEIFNFV